MEENWMSKARAKGTAAESLFVKWFQARGFEANRLAEGGSLDEGDIEVQLYGRRWLAESKARSALSAQTALAKARAKAKGAPTMLIWKRLTVKPGNLRATPVAGEAVVVFMSMDDLSTLLETANRAGFEDGKEYGFTHTRGNDD